MDGYGLVIPALTFAAVICLGGAVLAASFSRKRILEARLAGTSQQSSLYQDEHSAERSWLVRLLARIGVAASGRGPSNALRMQMVRAGFHAPAAVPVYLGAKVTLFAIGGVLSGALVAGWAPSLPKAVLIVAVGAGCLFFLPNLYLEYRASRRATEVRHHLPDVVDLLEISVSGGMGLDMAWNAVADEIRSVSTLLADEMALANLEMHLGEERGTAIRNMAERTGADELASLVAVLVQSQRFGTSVAEALKTFAVSMRELRSQRAQEHAEKMAVKMLFPMVVLIFPVVMVVAIGPAALKIIEVFGAR